MLRNRLVTAIMAGTIGFGAIGGSVAAYARNNDKPTDEAAIMATAKITMAQAIAAAEQQVGGKAVGSGIEDQDGTAYFEVEVLKDGKRQKVLIDSQTGKVVKTVDNNKKHDEDEGDED